MRGRRRRRRRWQRWLAIYSGAKRFQGATMLWLRMDRALEADARGSLCVTRGPQGHLLSPLWTASDTSSTSSTLSPLRSLRFSSSFFPSSGSNGSQQQRRRLLGLLLTPLLSLSPRRVISFRSCKLARGNEEDSMPRWNGRREGRGDRWLRRCDGGKGR